MEIINEYNDMSFQFLENFQQEQTPLYDQKIDHYDILTEVAFNFSSNYDFQSQLDQTNFYINHPEVQIENLSVKKLQINKYSDKTDLKKIKKIKKTPIDKKSSLKKNTFTKNKQKGTYKDFNSLAFQNLDISNKPENPPENLFSNLNIDTNIEKNEESKQMGIKKQNEEIQQLQFENQRKNLSRYLTNRLKQIWKQIKSQYQLNNINYLQIQQLFNNKNTSIKNIKKILHYHQFRQMIIEKYLYTGKLYNMIMNIDMKIQNKAIYIKYFSQIERAIQHPDQFQSWI